MAGRLAGCRRQVSVGCVTREPKPVVAARSSCGRHPVVPRSSAGRHGVVIRSSGGRPKVVQKSSVLTVAFAVSR
ncbi:MAG: hypothetical protein HQ512_05640 [Rhodospirillales bacterium]|nr:hypothetical protein [Rhodospirillales bacterium]